jgi:hypothetical protein
MQSSETVANRVMRACCSAFGVVTGSFAPRGRMTLLNARTES